MDAVEEDVAALLREADALMDVGRYDAAIERAQEAARRAPNDARVYQVWSQALRGADKFFDAASMADTAIRLAPDDPVGHRLRGHALVQLATKYPSERLQYALDAADSAEEAIRLTPNDPNGHIVLAQALSLLSNHEEADAELQKAIRLAPNSPVTWVTASVVAMRAQHWEAAITACRRALALEANNYAALNNLGVSLRASGRGAEGSRVLARAAQVSPDDTMARQNLSRAGIRAARIAVMIVLIPVGLLTHLGFLLYGAFAIGSNVLISKRPDLVLRLERWAVPIALFVARRPGGRATTSSARTAGVENELTADRPWSAVGWKWQLRPWVILLGALTAGTVAIVLAVLTAAAPGWDKLAVAAAAVIFAAVTMWLATVFVRRRA